MIILPEYNEPHRHYHNPSHIRHMLDMLKGFGLSDTNNHLLRTAINYHDIVYEPGASDNEERSVQVFRDFVTDNNLDVAPNIPGFMDIVEGLIMATKKPFEPKTELEKLMVYIDWSHFAGDYRKLNEVNMNMFKEFQKFPLKDYIAGRDHFLLHDATPVPQKLVGQYVSQEMADELVKGIVNSTILADSFRPRIGIYVGSFNPFHLGHQHIVRKAEQIMDKVIIVQAVNGSKSGEQAPLPQWYQTYYETHRAAAYEPITAIVSQIADDLGDYYLIRGIRNDADLTAEQTYMRVVKDMGLNIPVQHILCDAEFQHISSSVIRQLNTLGFDLYGT